ncbi:MAG TPA: EAL domain-containing protein [Bryobacteraceae bacterium]|nr:EAL domain-containing protein [Bryobacteraceae bacterium]
MKEAAKRMLDLSKQPQPKLGDSPELIYVHDLEGNILSANAAFERVTGYSCASLTGKNFFAFLTPEYRCVAEQMILEQIGGGKEKPAYNVCIHGAAGNDVLLEVNAELLFANGAPAAIQASGRHVAEEIANTAAERQLLEKTSELARFSRHLQLLHRLSTTNYEHLHNLLKDYVATGCEIFSVLQGVVTRVHEDLHEIRASQGGVTKLHQPLFTRITAEQKTLTSTMTETAPYLFFIGTPILLNERVFGTIAFWSTEAQFPAIAHPQGREIIELMAKSIGIAIDQRQLTTQLAYQAHHDALTGLPNRVLLKDRLDHAIVRANENDSLLAVLFIDLDRFKQINDTLGHSVGDDLLKEVARKLQNALKPGHTLARMGGDEFTAILTDTESVEKAVETARTMLAALRAPHRVDSYELFVTASMGLSFYPYDGTDAATLLQNADAAMYVAKNSGKNDVHCFSAEGSAKALERLEMENYLRRALDNDEFQIHYQPQVELNGKLAGLEVLLVWDHPKMGRVSPGQFIPIAEESGMILPIGFWVLRKACEQAAQWQRDGYEPVRIAVNVSALQFGQSDFVNTVAEILSETGLAAGWLELELTESLVMRDVEQSVKRMSELRSLGIRITIDDFGTGYSSLSYLRRLPADALKIDQSFLREIELGPGSLPLIQTIVILAHNMGLSVTAEGVETTRQLELIREAGCDEAQGHYFGSPVESSDVTRLLTGLSSQRT